MKNSEIRAQAWLKTKNNFLGLFVLSVVLPLVTWFVAVQWSAVMTAWALLAPAIPTACIFFTLPMGLYFLEKDRLPVGEAMQRHAQSGRLGVSAGVFLVLLVRFIMYMVVAISISFFLVGKLLAHTQTDGLFALILLIPVTYAITLFGMVFLSVRYLFASFIAFSTHLSVTRVMKETRAFFRRTFFPLLSLLISFIGWDLLSLLSGGFALIWVVPYKQMALSIFFNHYWKQRFSPPHSNEQRKENDHA